ncbi:MAG: DUF5060 domain-containing protein [Lentisphaeria bacterium]|nr:DUF5060 domain-containing protein [Lentisphaeria bacterium]
MTAPRSELPSPVRIGAIEASAAVVPQGGRLELSFPVEGEFANPYDPGEIDITCVFRLPSGDTAEIPAFHYTPYEREADGTVGREGAACWKVRFTPTRAGEHHFRIRVRTRGGETLSPEGSFRCTAADYKGFIRVSRANPFAFEYDDGTPYMPIGINVFSWAKLGQALPPARLGESETHMNRLADAKGTFVRLRADSWWYEIENTADEASGYRGPGWYHPRACWEIDQLYDLAARRGLYIMHCLYNANGMVNGAVAQAGGARAWRRRYAFCLEENGGPCGEVAEFWTDPAMAELVRRRLRYCVARWGYSPNLMCWEFWNELVPDTRLSDAQVAWHRDMGRYLRGIDPWRHPVSNSLMGKSLDAQDPFWQLPEMEVVQVHSYQGENLPVALADVVRQSIGRWRKPFFLGEQGIIHRDGTQGQYPYDPEGLHLHNGLWAPVMAGASGPGAFWFVAGYLDRLGLYGHYTALAEYGRDIPWTEPSLRPLLVDGVALADPGVLPQLTDGRLHPGSRAPFDKARAERFEVDPLTGRCSNEEELQGHLHAGAERKTTPTFVLQCREAATFRVEVEMSVGDGANRLVVELDGAPVVERAFPAGEGLGKASEHVPQYGNWRTVYGETIEVPVPAGRHEIRLEAFGKDRLEVGYSLSRYFSPPPVVVTGLRTGDRAWFWVRNRTSMAYTLRAGQSIDPVPATKATLSGLGDGRYSIEWWDSWRGVPTGTVEGISAAGSMSLAIPPFRYDIAAKCSRIE